ncbi:unnamed protein product, partial [Closterium sp. NIES-54]
MLAALGFFPSSTDTPLFIQYGTTPFYIIVYIDDMELATPNRATLASLKVELLRRHTCTDLGELRRYLRLQITRDKALRTITQTQLHMVQYILDRFRLQLSYAGASGPQSWWGASYDVTILMSSRVYCFSLGVGAVSWRSTRSSSVEHSSCEAEIYEEAMASQELRWLTFLLTDLGEPSRSATVLFADNKAMILLCQELRLEGRVKHIQFLC